MRKKIQSPPDELPVEASAPDIDHGTQSSISRNHASVKVVFFIGQAIILLLFPFAVLAAVSEFPGWFEAQANEVLILALCANIPFVIFCVIIAWLGFVKSKIYACSSGQ